MTDTVSPRNLTPRDLAARWQCSERHVRNLIASGELPAFRLGGKLLRIRMEDVEAFERQSAGDSSYRHDAEPSLPMSGATEIQSTGGDVLPPKTTRRKPAVRLDLK